MVLSIVHVIATTEVRIDIDCITVWYGVGG